MTMSWSNFWGSVQQILMTLSVMKMQEMSSGGNANWTDQLTGRQNSLLPAAVSVATIWLLIINAAQLDAPSKIRYAPSHHVRCSAFSPRWNSPSENVVSATSFEIEALQCRFLQIENRSLLYFPSMHKILPTFCEYILTACYKKELNLKFKLLYLLKIEL